MLRPKYAKEDDVVKRTDAMVNVLQELETVPMFALEELVAPGKEAHSDYLHLFIYSLPGFTGRYDARFNHNSS